LRIIFAGTPEFAAVHLQALLDAKHDIVAVYTQPDRPAGRGNKLNASAVKEVALANNLPIYQPQTLKAQQAIQELTNIKADLMVVVAYGLILPKDALSAALYGCINVHGSILPKWRGAAPIQRAIWAGDKETGITIMKMDEGLDTGDILSVHRLPIAPQDTSAVLYEKLAELGPKALTETLAKFKQLQTHKQDDSVATYAAKLSKVEAYLDWQLTAIQLERNVRAFNPWPVAWFTYQDKPIKVWLACVETLNDSDQLCCQPGQVLAFDKHGLKIASTQGALVIQRLQLAGKKPQDIAQLVNGQADLFSVNEVLL
jgi:methionyl-tRNA formyltransferase